jgi:hypothetical protein
VSRPVDRRQKVALACVCIGVLVAITAGAPAFVGRMRVRRAVDWLVNRIGHPCPQVCSTGACSSPLCDTHAREVLEIASRENPASLVPYLRDERIIPTSSGGIAVRSEIAGWLIYRYGSDELRPCDAADSAKGDVTAMQNWESFVQEWEAYAGAGKLLPRRSRSNLDPSVGTVPSAWSARGSKVKVFPPDWWPADQDPFPRREP